MVLHQNIDISERASKVNVRSLRILFLSLLISGFISRQRKLHEKEVKQFFRNLKYCAQPVRPILKRFYSDIKILKYLMNLSVLQKRLRTVDYLDNLGSVFDSKF